jgi:Transposase
VRAYLLKEDFQQFWNYDSPAWAGKFLDQWCTQTLRSRIGPMKKIALTLRNHRELLLNYLRRTRGFWAHNVGIERTSNPASVASVPKLAVASPFGRASPSHTSIAINRSSSPPLADRASAIASRMMTLFATP